MKNRFSRTLVATGMVAAMIVMAGCATKSTPMQNVRILEPANNAVVGTSFKVRFGVAGMAVEPAGDVVANSGHNHLLINLDSITAGKP